MPDGHPGAWRRNDTALSEQESSMAPQEPVHSTKNEFESAIERAWLTQRDIHTGAVANYIPELSKANPNDFGLAIATVNGKIYAIGDTEIPFTIQSISKAFAFCLALEVAGPELVAS